ncbi:DUF1173 family protein [Marinobacteraceae bacterium S3BR75-40.1]
MAVPYKIKIQFDSGKEYFLKPCGQSDKTQWDVYQGHLRAARNSKAIVTCACAGIGPRRLTIRLRGENHYLAKFALSGPEHHPLCRYYTSPPENSGLQAYERCAVEDIGDGCIQVRLRFGLTENEPTRHTGADYDPTINRQGTTRQKSMTLLGLLHLLWTEAQFNLWHPNMDGKRWPTTIHKYLREAAASQRIGGHRLSQHLLLPANKTGKVDYAAKNKKLVKDAITNRRRLIVISELRPFGLNVDLVGGRAVPMNYFNGFPFLNIGDEIVANVLRRFEREVNAWRNGSRVIAIVFTNKPQKAMSGAIAAEVCEMALMRISDTWIPLDSELEAEVELKLRKEQRFFEKPLRFDASKDDVFPDFILFDVPGTARYPMEVFGMDTPEYLARKAVKLSYFKTNFGDSWWEWDKTVHAKLSEADSFPAKDDAKQNA